ncbi:hypothetical protein [Noviluteimonas dokdonensis]|uniref:hypothetical protein n=1 Tax=Noviluteimonas dokdonensis TaxID=414050 RepID=UPI001269E6A4|nr:hypothetical protein [Lysobacter dokdonensis]
MLALSLAALAWWTWGASHVRAKSAPLSPPSEVADAAAPTPSAARGASSNPRVRVDGLGDPNLHLLTTLRRAVAERGPDDLVVAEMNVEGLNACLIVRDIPADDFRRKSPRHAWAIDYVERACVDFAVQGTKVGEIPALRDFRTLRKADPDAATAQALDILRESGSRTQIRAALNHLSDVKRYPLEVDPSLDPMERMFASEYAMIPVVCGATNDCGSTALAAATLCMSDGCLPGTTYEQALRRRLSPREYESAIRMRASLLALRAGQR